MIKYISIFFTFFLFITLPICSETENCARSQPSPTLRSKIPFKIVSKKTKDNWTYIEEVEIDSNTRFLIENKGCESYWVEYKFISKKYQKNDSISFFINSLEKISSYNTSPINLKKILSILKIASEKELYNKEIKISENEFGEYFTLTKEIGKHSEIKYNLSVVIGL